MESRIITNDAERSALLVELRRHDYDFEPCWDEQYPFMVEWSKEEVNGHSTIVYTDRYVGIRSITLIARLWFRRGPGTTYHSVEILIDGKMVHRIPYAYGYDRHYEDTAKNWLFQNGYLPGIEMMSSQPDTIGESLYSYCERRKIAYTVSVTDVTRKKDL